MKKMFNVNKKTNYSIMLLLVGIFVIIVLDSLKTTYDNDSWWLIATGREIVKKGFPKYNPWSIHSGMKVVIQQWIPSVALYLLYSIGKMPAIEVYLGILIVIFTLLLYYSCRYISDYRCGGEINLLVIIIAIYPMTGYFSCRPQIFSMMAYSLIIWLLEAYRRTDKIKYIVWLPFITMLHVNFHASMVLFDLFIIGLYGVPNIPSMIKNKYEKCSIEFVESDYSRSPLFVVLCLASLSLLINPYGVKGALYLIESYKVADYQNAIAEMQVLQMYNTKGLIILLLIVVGGIVIGNNGVRKIDFPLYVLFFSSIVLTIQHTRNIWFTPLFFLPLISSGVGKIHIKSIEFSYIRRELINYIETIILVFFVFLYGYANIWPTMVDYIDISKTDTIDLPQKAADYMSQYANENNLERCEIRILNSFNNGGLLEYYGFKVLMDARPELWESAISEDDNNYYYEYTDWMLGDTDVSLIPEKYDFDFYIVREGGGLEEYMQNNTDHYYIVEECNGYKLWSNVNS